MGDGSALPVGVPVPWPLPNPPSGWLKYNGAPFDKNLYPKLAAVYPSGILPDLRGEFIRGWDDGKGVDLYRPLLSNQSDAIRNITGGLRTVNTENYSIWESTASFSGALVPLNPSTNNGYYELIGLKVSNINNTTYPKAVGFDASKTVPTANENRPRNIAFNYI
ncbi:tail fiber protein, partial [Salmonella enterica]|nr:tail fiber protein [Salmonella enterica]